MTENGTDGVAVTVERAFEASPEHAFDAWLDPEAIGTWMFPAETDEIVDVHIDPRVDGKVAFDVRHDDIISHVGRYLEIDRRERLAFTWGTADAWTAMLDSLADLIAATEP